MVKFTKIANADDGNFAEAIAIYSAAFPPNERHPVEVIRERVRQGSCRLHVGYVKSEIVFFALVWPLANTDFVLLDYMATKEAYQNRGIGSSFMKTMRETLVRNKKRFIIEVEDLNYGANKEQRQRRLAFYKRAGAKEMKDVGYILPSLDGTEPTKMNLLVFPAQPNESMTGPPVKNLLIQIYRELYGRDRDDALLGSFINSIGDRIELV